MFLVLIHCLPGFELVLLITMPSPTYACSEQARETRATVLTRERVLAWPADALTLTTVRGLSGSDVIAAGEHRSAEHGGVLPDALPPGRAGFPETHRRALSPAITAVTGQSWERKPGTWIKAPLSSPSLSSCLNSTVTALSQSMAAISTSVVLFMTIPPKKSVARKPEDEGREALLLCHRFPRRPVLTS